MIINEIHDVYENDGIIDKIRDIIKVILDIERIVIWLRFFKISGHIDLNIIFKELYKFHVAILVYRVFGSSHILVVTWIVT